MKKFVVFGIAVLMIFSSASWADGGEIARGMFAAGIQDREPVGASEELNTSTNPVYFFTEFKNYTDHALTHKWMFNDKVMAEVTFNVKGPRWRVNSSKQMLPEWTGDWTVLVMDGEQMVGEYHLDYKVAE